MRIYHRTSVEAAAAILSGGFRDGDYQVGGERGELTGGVEFSSAPYPADQLPHAKAAVLLAISIPDDVLEPWEWHTLEAVPDPPRGIAPYREFFVPAEVVNRYGSPPAIVDED
jgi:hypothetical protein